MSDTSLDVIFSRHSCRHFTGEPLSAGDLERLLEAMRWAPSAGNRQPWFFYVVRNRKTKEELAEAALGQDFLVDAPVVFVVCAEPERSASRYRERGRSLYCLQDTAAAVENLLIAATALGYGACWIGAFDERLARRALNVPQDLRPVAIVPVGPGRLSATGPPRRPIEEITALVD